MSGLRTWLLAFGLTQAIEAPIYARALREHRRRWVHALLPSAITHPVVWFVIPDLWERAYLALVLRSERFVIRSPGWRYTSMVLLAETFAVLVEAAYVRALGLRRALGWSLLANAASVTAGLLWDALVGWH